MESLITQNRTHEVISVICNFLVRVTNLTSIQYVSNDEGTASGEATE